MDFRRKLSSGSESFSEGTSRFFSSVIAKKNGLMNDLSNKIESVGATLMKSSPSGSSLSDSADDAASTKYEQEINQNNPKSRKDKENSEEKLSSPSNKSSHKLSKHHRRQGSHSSSGSGETEEGYPVTGVNMSFDEPLYSPQKVTSPERSAGIGPSWKGRNTPPVIPPPPFNPNKTGRRSSRSSTNSPKMSSGHSSDSEKYMDGDKNINDEKTRAPSFAQTKRRSSTVDEMLFDDYVENKEEEKKPESPPADDVFQKRKTLLPMGDLISFDEPELEDFHPKPLRKSKDKDGEKSLEKSFPSVSSAASSDIDYDEAHLNNQTSVDSSEPEYEHDRAARRLDSMGSERSWSSNYSLDSQPDDLTLECMGFMKGFVDNIFNPRCSGEAEHQIEKACLEDLQLSNHKSSEDDGNVEDIAQVEKAKFGEYCQQVPGRQWFARYVNSQRVVSKKVEESIFFRLVQYFAVVLFECNEAEDFVPAKNLMNMCFTFYHESRHGKQRFKNFLYSYLREQPIWQSLRFWNAAFFDAVQNERARKPVCTSEDGQDSQTDDSMFQENITFGQLGTFTCNMRAFGLNKELCLEFLRKQSTIADLKTEQIKMLKDNIEKWREQ